MKKPLFLFLLFVIIVVRSHAQTNGGVSLSLGPAIPLGEYASTGATDLQSGLARIGAVADLCYQHPFGKSRFGWTITLRGRFNGVDKSATLAPFEAEFPGYNWNIKSGRWTTASALVGGYYQIPLKARLSLLANIGVGVAESWSPKQAITGVRDSAGRPIDLVQASLHSVSATSFTALAGLDLRYQWNGRWSLQGGIDYTYLKPTFDKVTATVGYAQGLIIPGLLSLNNASIIEYNSLTRNYTQPMSCIDIKVGVVRTL